MEVTELRSTVVLIKFSTVKLNILPLKKINRRVRYEKNMHKKMKESELVHVEDEKVISDRLAMKNENTLRFSAFARE